jgi:hypothetical protein
MMHRRSSLARAAWMALFLTGGLIALPSLSRAQDEAPVPPMEEAAKAATEEAYKNNIAGEFTPAKGFDLIKTARGSLNISGYGLFRWVDQTPGEQTYTDHLGRTRTVKARNDINWHRTMVWFSGFLGVPEFRYTLTVWSLPTTQQTLAFGVLRYRMSKAAELGVGIAPNLSSRSMAGSHPFWAASDRQMGEEFFRGGFSSGVFIRGEPISRVNYTASINTNLSQLGVTATNDTREMAYSGTLTWMPTTGEFGPRGGFGDLENHQALATRFGTSACHTREGRGAPVGQPNGETQIRLSDGVYLFEEGALADGITVRNADYDYLSFDAAAKYKGFCFQGEYYFRRLSKFDAVHGDLTTGPSFDAINDNGFMVQAGHMVVPKKLLLYACGGYVFDDFKREPWEVSGGASFYPMGTRSLRLNLHLIKVEKSPTGSNFGYYTAGQSGTTVSAGVDILY